MRTAASTGNGAVIAPRARLDDGRLDVVIVASGRLIRACVELPFVFTGTIDRVGGVPMEATESMEITSPHPVAVSPRWRADRGNT